MKHRKSILALLLTMAMFAMTACQSKSVDSEEDGASKKDVTLTFMVLQAGMTNQWEGPFIDELIPEYEELTGVKVELQVMPDTTNEAVKLKLATGEAPEMFQANLPQMVTMVNATKYCMPLDDQPWVERLVNPDLIRYQGDDKIYGFPMQSSSWYSGMFYDEELLSSIGIEDPNPATWQEFLDLCEEIKAHGITPLYMTDKDSWTTQYFTTMGFAVATAGKEEIWDDLLTNKMKFAEVQEFEDILYNLQELYTLGYVNDDHMSQPYDQKVEVFENDLAAMMLGDESTPQNILLKYPESQIGAFEIPFADNQLMATGNFVSGIYVCKDSKYLEETLEFLDWLSQPEQMNRIYEAHPAYSAFTDCESGESIACVNALYEDYILTGKYVYEFDSYLDDARSIMNDGLFVLIQQLVNFEITPEELLTEWDEMFSDLMHEKGIEGF